MSPSNTKKKIITKIKLITTIIDRIKVTIINTINTRIKINTDFTINFNKNFRIPTTHEAIEIIIKKKKITIKKNSIKITIMKMNYMTKS